MTKIKYIFFLCIVLVYIVFNANIHQIEVPFQQWALNNIEENSEDTVNYDTDAIKAWKITKGDPNVIISILDSGIDIKNKFIEDNLYYNFNESLDGSDTDNNGYIDDLNGWDFYNNSNVLFKSSLSDYHGTFVTSLIVGKHTKDNQVWGIAPKVTILPLKVMEGTSGDIEDTIPAIDYAYQMGSRIINISWDTQYYNDEIFDTMNKYSDVLFITSAGKEGNNLNRNPVFPCSYELDNLICVGAVDITGNKYLYSGYGLEDMIYAPGVDIIGIVPEEGTTYLSGTSFSTAYVSGVAGLLKSFNLELSPKQIKNAILSSSEKVDNLMLLNASKALEFIRDK